MVTVPVHIKTKSKVTLTLGDDMNSKEMLTSVLHTVQMGQSGIKCVKDQAVRPALKRQLEKQLTEYDAMESKARQLAKAHKWQIRDINPGILKMSDMMAKAKLLGGERDSKIAGMMIQGNTRGMIQGLKNLRQGKAVSQDVQDLTQKLIEFEHTGIEDSKPYL